jgi:hypothetical protein
VSNFYVYLHLRGDNGKPFYVGKGTKGRANDKGHRNRHWHNIVAKHGYTVEILFDGLDNKESGQVEIDVITELRYFGYELCNYTNGGEGKLGYKTSDETKRKISESNKGKKISDEHKRKLSAHFTGRVVSKETREKLSKNNVFRRKDVIKKIAESNKIPVLCSNGVLFDSATDANNWIVENGLGNAKDGSSITACCTGRQKTAYGYKWQHVNRSN